jgi:hypothetical protein
MREAQIPMGMIIFFMVDIFSNLQTIFSSKTKTIPKKKEIPFSTKRKGF